MILIKLLILAFAIYVFIAVIINGLFMLVSPKAWFRLPCWFRAIGWISARKSTSDWGGAQIRLLGAMFVGVMAYVVYSMFITHHGGSSPRSEPDGLSSFIGSKASHLFSQIVRGDHVMRAIVTILWGLVTVGITVNGSFMLVSPHAWLRLPWWIRGKQGFTERILVHRWGTVFLRCSGVIFLSVAALFVYAFISNP